MNINHCCVAGNLTRDIELRFTAAGCPVANVGMALQRVYFSDDTKVEETVLLDVSLFGKRAEVLASRLRKGDPVYFEGQLEMQTWIDKKSGRHFSKIKLHAEEFQFVGPCPSATAKHP